MIKTAKKLDQITLSKNTMTWRVEELASDIHRQYQIRIKLYIFSIEIDESNDTTYTAHVEVFVSVINDNFNFIVEILGLQSLHSTAKESYLFEILKTSKR
ncbi:hypothetical protein RF11_13681 [Thelohanellus kitauei]|uniref:Uncharacterized protein n=1 Tax=Thelohanellus kitauei TaxID=669202 RepID=A0A0C2IZJ9_THEKT|nr:hypothetical protein RF11_13681 [Thelohanellus kitauei]